MANALSKEKRQYMADTFAKTQMAMSQTVDLLGLERRRAVPYSSTWEGSSISEHGPIPTDAHLIPSNLVIVKPEMPSFKLDEDADAAGLATSPMQTLADAHPAAVPPERPSARAGRPIAEPRRFATRNE